MKQTANNKNSKLFLIAIIVALFLITIILCGLTLINNQDKRALLSDIYSPFIEIIVLVIIFFTVRKSSLISKRLRNLWLSIGLAFLAYALGDISWLLLELIFKSPPFPSIADAFYLIFYPLFFFCVLTLPASNLTHSEKIKNFLDISIIMMAAILGFWNFLIGPLQMSLIGQPIIEQIILVAYPIGDVILLWSLVVIIYSKLDELPKGSLIFLGISITIMIISDSIYGYQSMMGTYFSGNILDAGYILSIILTGLAGIYQLLRLTNIKTNAENSTKLILPTWIKGIFSLFPYLWLISAFLILVQSNIYPLSMGFIPTSIYVGAIIGLVIIRQAITLLDNNKLNRNLKESLGLSQALAKDLENGNRLLELEIIERKRVENELAFDALHDHLTGLPNRSLLLDRLNQVIKYNERVVTYPFSVLFIDLDSFKVINDSLGHNMGDQLLMQVGKRLQNSLRSSDTVARLGGDEFIILLENDNEGIDPLPIIQKIQKSFSIPFQFKNNDLFITASIGVVKSIIGYDNADNVLRDADLAMYRAKQLGKARFEIFDNSMLTLAISRMAIENELRYAIKNNELRLFYQPIFRVNSKKLIGFEALIRWQHPQKGLLPPSEFLDIAEESGLIMPITEWVLLTACSKLKTWQDNYPRVEDITVSVNISGKGLSQLDFVESIEKSLIMSGLKGTSLILEITENVLITNFSRAKEIFSDLNEKGVQIQIDDFGSGYSSLSYIQHFPVNALKIDRSFISKMLQSIKGQELVASMINMTQNLGIDCIAEGIETQEQLAELDQMHCLYGQGFLISKPLPEDSAEVIFANGIPNNNDF